MVGLVMAIHTKRALIFNNDNLFTTFDFPVKFDYNDIPSPYRETASRMRYSDRGVESDWLRTDQICNYNLTMIDTVQHFKESGFMYTVNPSPKQMVDPPFTPDMMTKTLRPGLLTANGMFPGMVSDPVINDNLVMMDPMISNAFVWHLGAYGLSDQFRSLLQNINSFDYNPYQALMNSFFLPKPVHMDIMKETLALNNIPFDSPDIGVHIRRHYEKMYFFPDDDSRSISIFVNTVGRLVVTKLCRGVNEDVARVDAAAKVTVFMATDIVTMFDYFKQNLNFWLNKYMVDNAESMDCPDNLVERVIVFQTQLPERSGDSDLFPSMIDFWLLSRSKFIVGTHISSYSGAALMLSRYPTAMQCMVDNYNTCVMTSNIASWHIHWEARGGVPFVLGETYLGNEFDRSCQSRMDVNMMIAHTGFVNPMFVTTETPVVSTHPELETPEMVELVSSLKQKRTTGLHQMISEGNSKTVFYAQWWRFPEYMRQMWREREAVAAYLYQKEVHPQDETLNQRQIRRRQLILEQQRLEDKIVLHHNQESQAFSKFLKDMQRNQVHK